MGRTARPGTSAAALYLQLVAAILALASAPLAALAEVDGQGAELAPDEGFLSSDRFLTFRIGGDGPNRFGGDGRSAGNTTISLSDGWTYSFGDLVRGDEVAPPSPDGGPPLLRLTAENGLVSLVLIEPSSALPDPNPFRRYLKGLEEDGLENRQGAASLFRAMINDADRGVVYEFLPDVSTGEMVVISRRHSDLPGPAPREPGPNGETRRRMADKDEDRAGPGELLRQVGGAAHSLRGTIKLYQADQLTDFSRNAVGSSYFDGPKGFGCGNVYTKAVGHHCIGGNVKSVTIDTYDSCRNRCGSLEQCAALMFLESADMFGMGLESRSARGRCFLYDVAPTGLSAAIDDEGAFCELNEDKCPGKGTTFIDPPSRTFLTSFRTDGCLKEDENGCKVCQGDCDRDSDCYPGLKCFQRDGNEEVPGCDGTGKGAWDYCYDPTTIDSSPPAPAQPVSRPPATQIAPTPRPPTRRPPTPSPPTPLVNVPGDTIDVLVVWSRWAECANANPRINPAPYPCQLTPETATMMRRTIDLSIAQSNEIFVNSGVSTRVRLVYAYRASSDFWEDTWGNDLFSKTLRSVTNKKDGVLDEVHKHRDFYGADVVSAFIYNPRYGYCGKAWAGAGKPEDASNSFSVVDYRCATSRYDFIHEIAHNLGSFHDRGTEGTCGKNQNQPAYGYRHPQYPYRTLMAYDCNAVVKKAPCDIPAWMQGNRCSILPVLSGPKSKYVINDVNRGPVEITMGNSGANNAEYIQWASKSIAKNRDVSPATVGCTRNEDCPAYSQAGICWYGQCLYDY